MSCWNCLPERLSEGLTTYASVGVSVVGETGSQPAHVRPPLFAFGGDPARANGLQLVAKFGRRRERRVSQRLEGHAVEECVEFHVGKLPEYRLAGSVSEPPGLPCADGVAGSLCRDTPGVGRRGLEHVDGLGDARPVELPAGVHPFANRQRHRRVALDAGKLVGVLRKRRAFEVHRVVWLQRAHQSLRRAADDPTAEVDVVTDPLPHRLEAVGGPFDSVRCVDGAQLRDRRNLECPTCAMQMEHSTGYEIRHPLEL